MKSNMRTCVVVGALALLAAVPGATWAGVTPKAALVTDGKGHLELDYHVNLAKTKIVAELMPLDGRKLGRIAHSEAGDYEFGMWLASSFNGLYCHNYVLREGSETPEVIDQELPANCYDLGGKRIRATFGGNELKMKVGDLDEQTYTRTDWGLQDVTIDSNLWLFASKYGSELAAEVYAVDIYEDGTLVRQLRPCVTEDGVATLYDELAAEQVGLPVVNGDFSANDGEQAILTTEDVVSEGGAHTVVCTFTPSVRVRYLVVGYDSTDKGGDFADWPTWKVVRRIDPGESSYEDVLTSDYAGKFIRYFILEDKDLGHADYAQENLVALYDVARNTASGYDIAAKTWADLSGNGNDLVSGDDSQEANLVLYGRGNGLTLTRENHKTSDGTPVYNNFLRANLNGLIAEDQAKTVEFVCKGSNFRSDDMGVPVWASVQNNDDKGALVSSRVKNMVDVCGDGCVGIRGQDNTGATPKQLTAIYVKSDTHREYHYTPNTNKGVVPNTRAWANGAWHAYSGAFNPAMAGSSLWYDGTVACNPTTVPTKVSGAAPFFIGNQGAATHTDYLTVGESGGYMATSFHVIRVYSGELPAADRELNLKIDRARFFGEALPLDSLDAEDVRRLAKVSLAAGESIDLVNADIRPPRINWTGAGQDGLWSNPDNWGGYTILPTDAVVFDGVGEQVVKLTEEEASVKKLFLLNGSHVTFVSDVEDAPRTLNVTGMVYDNNARIWDVFGQNGTTVEFSGANVTGRVGAVVGDGEVTNEVGVKGTYIASNGAYFEIQGLNCSDNPGQEFRADGEDSKLILRLTAAGLDQWSSANKVTFAITDGGRIEVWGRWDFRQDGQQVIIRGRNGDFLGFGNMTIKGAKFDIDLDNTDLQLGTFQSVNASGSSIKLRNGADFAISADGNLSAGNQRVMFDIDSTSRFYAKSDSNNSLYLGNTAYPTLRFTVHYRPEDETGLTYGPITAENKKDIAFNGGKIAEFNVDISAFEESRHHVWTLPFVTRGAKGSGKVNGEIVPPEIVKCVDANGEAVDPALYSCEMVKENGGFYLRLTKFKQFVPGMVILVR